MGAPSTFDMILSSAREPHLVAALREAENALDDYIERLEKQGSMMGYGRKVLIQVRAALALHDGTAAKALDAVAARTVDGPAA